MRDHDEPIMLLTVRIPARLRYRVRLHCVETEQEMQRFVAAAILERIQKQTKQRRAAA